MKFKLALYAPVFKHSCQVFHLKCEILSIEWSSLKHLGKLKNGKQIFTKSLFSVQFNLNFVLKENFRHRSMNDQNCQFISKT